MIMKMSIFIRFEDLVEVEVEPRSADQTITPEMDGSLLRKDLLDQEQCSD